MSIHSLAKELGVSEYSLKKFARENNLERNGTARRNSHIFTPEDIQYIREYYNRYEHKPRLDDEYYWIFYKMVLPDGKTRFSTPLGRFNFKWKEKLKDFVKLQEYTSKFGRKANHFHIVGEHTAILRIKRILKVDKNISKDELEFAIENLAKKLPLSDKTIKLCLEKKESLSEEQIKNFFINI